MTEAGDKDVTFSMYSSKDVMSKLALLVALKKLVRSQFAAQQFSLFMFLCTSLSIVIRPTPDVVKDIKC